MAKRAFDIIVSLITLVLVSPAFLICALAVKIESFGPIFFLQKRVGRNNKDFTLLKFRTMYVDMNNKSQLTIGMSDPRITRAGYFIRKYKLDELPQLINVLLGDMSLVGPRPEVRKYVAMYTEEQMAVLKARPGITDYASITYHNESELLAQAHNPEKLYVQEIMPHKLQMNLDYLNNRNFFTDLSILFKTFFTVVTQE